MALFQFPYTAGTTVYAIAWLGSNSNPIKTADGTSEAYNAAHLAQYAISFTGNGGLYTATVPTTLPHDVSINILVYERSGGSPASTDSVIGFQSGSYDGSEWLPDGSGGSGDSVWTSNQVQIVLAALAGGTITRVSPFDDDANDDFTLVAGDDYLDGRLSWESATDLTGASIYFNMTNTLGERQVEKTATLADNGTTIIVEFTAAETEALLRGTKGYKYHLYHVLDSVTTTDKLAYVSVIDEI